MLKASNMNTNNILRNIFKQINNQYNQIIKDNQ